MRTSVADDSSVGDRIVKVNGVTVMRMSRARRRIVDMLSGAGLLVCVTTSCAVRMQQMR